jgi:thioredoxin-dependent peroxiredoxin
MPRNDDVARPLALSRLLSDDAGPPGHQCLTPDETHPMRAARVTFVIALLGAIPVYAALPDGTKAPDINTEATLAGKEFKFSLADALKKGPVVLYFYPAAFTPGCTVEAHEFAEATAKFHELGATVIGVSHDPIEKLDKFSVSECRNKFAVASDADGSIMKAYDAVLPSHPEYANRTSYVIAPTGQIIYSYTAMNPEGHVDNTMAAVKKWRDEHAKS